MFYVDMYIDIHVHMKVYIFDIVGIIVSISFKF